MSKDTYYFPHDYNAIQDPKMMILLSTCGLMGVGLYWIIIEILHQQPDGTIAPEELKRYIEFYGHGEDMDDSKGGLSHAEAMLLDIKLLLIKDGRVYSERVLRNKQERAEKYAILAEAGRVGGLKSAQKRRNTPESQATLKPPSSHPQAGTEATLKQERKGNEIKGNERLISPMWTEQQVKDSCHMDGIPDDKAAGYFHHFNAQGFVRANGQPIKNLRSHINEMWDKTKSDWCWKEKEKSGNTGAKSGYEPPILRPDGKRYGTVEEQL